MAKKNKFSYKDLKVNEEDLSITKIGEMPNEDKSPIFLFVVFGLFLVFVFFLPDVVTYITGDDNVIINNPSGNEIGDTPSKEEGKELVYYDLSSDLVVNLDTTLKINNFNTSNNSLSFKITNNGDSKYYFSKKNYFVELYDDNKMLLERVILLKESVAKDNSKDFSYTILPATASNAKKIVFVEKEIEDYPNIELSKNEANEETLICVKGYESITYKFKEQKLSFITDTLNYTRSGSELDYQNDFSLWQSRVANYNNIEGISGTFISTDTGFIVNVALDLKNTKMSSVDNDNYYEYETLAKVVNFEMESRGFSCN